MLVMVPVCFFCLPDISTATHDGGIWCPITNFCIWHIIWRIKGKLWTFLLPSSQIKCSITIAHHKTSPPLTFLGLIPPHISGLQYNLHRQGHVQPQRDGQRRTGSFSLSLASHQGDQEGSYHATASSDSLSHPGQSSGCALSTPLH